MSLRIFSYIVSSIVGTGVLVLPVITTEYGFSSMIGLLVSTVVFLGTGYVFSKSTQPFLDIKESVPNTLYQCTSWIYWIFSWASTIIITYEMTNAVLKLCNFTASPMTISFVQCGIVIFFILLHRVGIAFINKIEIVITALKVGILSIIPILFLVYGIQKGMLIDYTVTFRGVLSVIPSMMWMYLGLESCGIVESKGAKPVILGILCVCGIYALNILGLLLTMNNQTNMAAPHAQVVGEICNIWFPSLSFLAEKLISVCVIVLCAGSINSWFVVSARIFQSIDTPKRIPKDYFSCLLYSTLGLIPLSFVVSSPNMKATYEAAFSYAGLITNVFYILCMYAITRKYKCYFIGTVCGAVLSAFLLYSIFCLASPILL